MQEMYQLFSNRVKKLLSDKIKGDIDVWVTEDTLNIKICKNDLMFNAKVNNVTSKIISERIDAEKFTKEITSKHRYFILHKYMTD